MMFTTGSAYAALLIFSLGLAYRVSTWFRDSIGSDAARIPTTRRFSAAVPGILGTLFSARLFTLLKVLLLDVVLQVRILRQDVFRWVTHMCLFGAFTALVLMHALGRYTTAALFTDYYSTVNPYLFLRNLFGTLVLLGVALAVYRRFIRRGPRPGSNPADVAALVLMAVILLSGFLLEAVKISSLSAFDEMVETYTVQSDPEELRALEAYWASEMGLVSHRVQGPFDAETLEQGRSAHELQCLQCHAAPQWAFGSYAASRALKPVAARTGGAGSRSVLWNVHFFSCLLGLAILPFSKMLHLFATPLSLLVNAVMEKGRSDPANIATRQIMELDACTHCGACTERCSLAPTLEDIPNVNILPSEKMASVKALVSGRKLSVSEVATIRQGLHLCTNCGRCTEVCPAGINLAELWINLREALLEKPVPEFLLLSPLSLMRGLTRSGLDRNRYADPLKRAREAIVEPDALHGPGSENLPLVPGFGGGMVGLNGSSRSMGFSGCYCCMTCSNSCPVVRNYSNPKEELGLLPHQLMHAMGLELWDLVFSSKMLWSCLGCYQCQESCPQRVPVSDVLYKVKNLAMARAQAKISSDEEDSQ
jgi:heterodisulfide reductase subunit C/nitrate reductase gamma subunit